MSDAEMGVRTLAWQGCLGDGSLLVLRLHHWWDHITSKGPLASAAASPRAGPKKKRKGGDSSNSGAPLSCVVEIKDEHLALRKRAVDVCKAIQAMPDKDAGGLSARQKNAICSLPLSLALTLLASEDEEDCQATAEPLTDVLEIIEQVPATANAVGKNKVKVLKQRAQILASLPTVAAELFGQDVSSLVREAAKIAWRELGMFTSDETLTSLCASVRDESAPADDKSGDEDEGEEDDDEEDGGPVTAVQASRIAAFEAATAAAKARNEREAAKGGKAAKSSSKKGDDDDDDDDDEDLTVLDNDGVLSQLLDDDDGGSLLESFAASGLDEAAPTPQKKLTKRQQQLRHKQEELNRKFREVELLEIFLARYGDKRQSSVRLVHDLYEALLKASASGTGSPKGDAEAAGAGEDGKGGSKNKKQSKADNALRRLEAGLAQRLIKLLARILRQLCRGPIVLEVSRWHSAEEWAQQARALCALGQSQKMTASGGKPLEVGSSLLYFFCAAHRSVSLGQDAQKLATGEGWSLTEELLGSVLREWGGKRDCDSWCQAALKAFAVRAPHVLRRLSWMEQIKSSRKAYAQRMQLMFVGNELLRPPSGGAQGNPSDLAFEGPPVAFVESFAELCAELLETSLSATASAEGEERGPVATTQSQKQKLRREALQGLKSALRVRQKMAERKAPSSPSQGGSTSSSLLSGAVAAAVARAVAGVRDALPSHQRRGEVYQLCLHILRIIRPQVGAGQGSSDRQKLRSPSHSPARSGKKKRKSDSKNSGDESASSKRARSREKGSKDGGRSASRSPSLKPKK
eukprot:TRINITY_DN19879_c0_g1_i1.p1 TRINITY_DN19879_c0_g1~~TRINITY_DN19879_c0_g1_i1.p1  ORF type:complete len:869 (+),score=224.93 TRINITY_DN19879_c0_g1_i1:196-2607(+)